MKLKIKVAVVLSAQEAALSLHMMEGYAAMKKERSSLGKEEEKFLMEYREVRGKAEEVFAAANQGDGE